MGLLCWLLSGLDVLAGWYEFPFHWGMLCLFCSLSSFPFSSPSLTSENIWAFLSNCALEFSLCCSVCFQNWGVLSDVWQQELGYSPSDFILVIPWFFFFLSSARILVFCRWRYVIGQRFWSDLQGEQGHLLDSLPSSRMLFNPHGALHWNARTGLYWPGRVNWLLRILSFSSDCSPWCQPIDCWVFLPVNIGKIKQTFS